VIRKAHVPLRMCMGCGERAPQAELVRVASGAGGMLERVEGRRQGRSGYLHRRTACWERFAARKGFLRSLGRPVDRAARLAFVHGLQRSDLCAMME
jgi:predicted RNA-binding protein YlxR (DUF448 family)